MDWLRKVQQAREELVEMRKHQVRAAQRRHLDGAIAELVRLIAVEEQLRAATEVQR